MNYILQVKAFNKLHLRDPFSKGQFMLFHALLDVNNDCGWLEWFDVALSRLELFSRLSREGVQKARAELVEKGLIEFKSNGTRAGSYRLKKLYEDSTQVSTQVSTQESTPSSTQESTPSSTQDSTRRVTKKERLNPVLATEKAENTQISTQVSTQESTQSSTQESTSLSKQNKTKQNKIKDNVSCNEYVSELCDTNSSQKTNILEFYQQNFGFPSSFVQVDILETVNEYGGDLVLEALKQTLRYKKEFGYAKTILERWKDRGIDSLEKVKEERARHVRSFDKKTNSYSRTGRVAPVPDYIANPNETKETKLSPEEEQKLREEINSLRSVGK